MKLHLPAWALTVSVSLASAWAQPNWDQVEIKAEKVSGNVHMLVGRGGNIGVSAGKDGLLIVDDQFLPLAEKIREALKSINAGSLRFVLNTHWHGDHTGSNPAFGKSAAIVAHDNVRKRLSSDQTVFGRVEKAIPPEGWPVVTFDESLSIHFNDEEIRVIHYPKGHTDGDSVIFFSQSNVVHMGDLFFKDRFPFVDLGSGGDVVGYAENVGKVIAVLRPDVKIIPGHGSLADLDDLKRYHRMLVETIHSVRGRMNAGQTLDQIQSQGLAEEWKSWGSGFINQDRWIDTIFKSLEKR